MVKRYGNLTVGLFVMDTGDYLHTFWPDSASVHELYNSLREVLQESKAKGTEAIPFLKSHDCKAKVCPSSFFCQFKNTNEQM